MRSNLGTPVFSQSNVSSTVNSPAPFSPYSEPGPPHPPSSVLMEGESNNGIDVTENGDESLADEPIVMGKYSSSLSVCFCGN